MSERRSCLFINVRVGDGSDISEFAADAIDLAKRTGCHVETRFTGILLLVSADDVVEKIVAEYRSGFGTWRDENHKPKVTHTESGQHPEDTSP